MKIKNIVSIILVDCLLLTLCACGKAPQVNPGEATKLSFKSALSYDYLKKLNGSSVTINGYMATSSPADGSFMFLMNLPFQSCPFCKPNTSQLSNTLEVYPAKNSKFDYTTQAIRVTGKLEVAESEKKPFTDEYGYEFNFKITDADYTIIKAEELGEEFALWSKIAQTDVINEVYKMYNYVYFLCAWNTYSVNSWTDEDGTEHPGFYLYASDALSYITEDDAQYNYGFKEGYFDGLVAKVRSVDPEAFEDLVKNIQQAETLATKALNDLQTGKYTKENKYVEEFGIYDDIYTITNADEFLDEYDNIYADFSNWLSSWEM